MSEFTLRTTSSTRAAASSGVRRSSSARRSILFSTSTGRTRSCSACVSTASVCTHTPSTTSTTTSAPSHRRSAAVTSAAKSTCPGQSTTFTCSALRFAPAAVPPLGVLASSVSVLASLAAPSSPSGDAERDGSCRSAADAAAALASLREVPRPVTRTTSSSAPLRSSTAATRSPALAVDVSDASGSHQCDDRSRAAHSSRSCCRGPSPRGSRTSARPPNSDTRPPAADCSTWSASARGSATSAHPRLPRTSTRSAAEAGTPSAPSTSAGDAPNGRFPTYSVVVGPPLPQPASRACTCSRSERVLPRCSARSGTVSSR
mmetsp:Transcript_20808/g.66878  ORF Transcript_20808/g.66878 Transcript_20808/m.66878 type:complete len:317 (+) Transcript_20808:2412-3362(+)